MQHFQPAVGTVAVGTATAGRGKLIAEPEPRPPLLRLACRDCSGVPLSDHDLIERFAGACEAAGFRFPRPLLVTYYVSLKTNPFVILVGPEGAGKTELVGLFAEALLGRGSPQYALLTGGAAWPSATGEEQSYRSLLDRFASLRFLDLLQEAADAGNTGKAYLVCFDAMRPVELEYYFGALLQVDEHGRKRLSLPGVPDERRPIVPPNVYITATVNAPENDGALSSSVLRHAGVMPLRDTPRATPLPHMPAPPPPVGFQRLFLRAARRDLEAARARLAQMIGADELARLRSSPELSRLLWRAGEVLTSQTLHALTAYVANSFDDAGCGLFDPHNPLQNARIAFDCQVAQRVLWRLRDVDDAELRRDLANYLDARARVADAMAAA